TPRHVSFLETGRSRPSHEMVLRLAAALEVPLGEQNALLSAAGFPPAFPERGLDAAALAPIRHVIGRLLASHAPYPALVMDRWYDVVGANDAGARLLLGGVAPDPDDPPAAIDLLLGPWRAVVLDWEGLAWAAATRLRREVVLAGDDERLAATLTRLEAALAGTTPRREGEGGDFDGPAALMRFRYEGEVLATFSTIVTFGGALDVTVEGLRIELFYPADARTDEVFRALGSSEPAADLATRAR
ncbi:MAG: helix-turn-helix transcriptional regulator, partial [Myxococcales bacterium]|nr:helix-turn-helix transcriptional regulator [Myxococcales bacterium]